VGLRPENWLVVSARLMGPSEMPRSGPGADRERLRFVEAVRSSFGFLEKRGFDTVVELSTMVRYESASVFVVVFHGRGSYELGVEIGHRFEVAGQLVDEKFALADVVALEVPLTQSGFRSFAATEADQLPGFLAQLSDWTERYGSRVLSDEPGVFTELRAAGVRRSEAMQDEWRASRLRDAAGAAWRSKDYPRVVDAYREIISELRSVELLPSELARLHFSEDRLDI
jgi:hypothetical protein